MVCQAQVVYTASQYKSFIKFVVIVIQEGKRKSDILN